MDDTTHTAFDRTVISLTEEHEPTHQSRHG